MKLEKIEEAQNYFDEMIKNSSKEEIEKVKNGGYGFGACFFAKKFITSDKDQKTYNKIYLIFYNYFENLKL